MTAISEKGRGQLKKLSRLFRERAQIHSRPVGSFTYAPDGVNPKLINFTSTSTDDGSVASYDWDFGDGGSSVVANPQHTYAAAGTYQVNLRVTDNLGETGEVTQPVTVL